MKYSSYLKTCNTCDSEKPKDNFQYSPAHMDYMDICKECFVAKPTSKLKKV